MAVVDKALETELKFPVPDRVVGDSVVLSKIGAAIQSSRLSRSIMICGAKGAGRKSLAYRLATSFAAHGQFGEDFAEDFANVSPFVQHSIRLLRQGAHPDILVLEQEGKKGEISVDSARKLQAFQGTTAAIGRAKVGIITDADALNISSANAILKVLEEPKKTLAVILVASQPKAVLPTILSRCTKFSLPPLSHEQLGDILQLNGVTLSSERLAWSGGNASLGLQLASSEFDEHAFTDVLDHLFGPQTKRLSPKTVAKLVGQEKALGQENVLRILLEAVRIRFVSTKKMSAISSHKAVALAQFEHRMQQRAALSLDSTASWMDALGHLRAMLVSG